MQGTVNPADCHHPKLAIIELVVFEFNGGFPFEAVGGIERDFVLGEIGSGLVIISFEHSTNRIYKKAENDVLEGGRKFLVKSTLIDASPPAH